jgi:hypothetical protein
VDYSEHASDSRREPRNTTFVYLFRLNLDFMSCKIVDTKIFKGQYRKMIVDVKSCRRFALHIFGNAKELQVMQVDDEQSKLQIEKAVVMDAHLIYWPVLKLIGEFFCWIYFWLLQLF